jgi:hypothetical protein
MAARAWVPYFIASNFAALIIVAFLQDSFTKRTRKDRILNIWFARNPAREHYQARLAANAPLIDLTGSLKARAQETVEHIMKLLEYEVTTLCRAQRDNDEAEIARFKAELEAEVADLVDCTKEACRIGGEVCEKEVSIHANSAFHKAYISTENKCRWIQGKLEAERKKFEDSLQYKPAFLLGILESIEKSGCQTKC